MKCGCTIIGAGKCILIATFDEAKGHKSADCNAILTELAKHLLHSAWPTAPVALPGTEAVSGASSWKPYIDNMLIGKGNIAHALICSKTDGKVWAASPGFDVSFHIERCPEYLYPLYLMRTHV